MPSYSGSDNAYVLEARCLLCRFQFEPGDIYIADLHGKRSNPLEYMYVGHVAVDEVAGVIIQVLPGGAKTTSPNFSTGYHESCLNRWGPELLPSSMSIGTLYEFSPPHTDDRRRWHRTRLHLATELPKLFPDSFLPTELWHKIASYNDIVQLYAVEAVRQLWEHSRSCSAELDLSLGIWAHYMFIDGVRYVERLTRVPPTPNVGQTDRTTCLKLLDSDSVYAKNIIYALEDHLGVRQIVFASRDEDLSRLSDDVQTAKKSDHVNNSWWRTVKLGPGRRLQVWSDGLKIRYVEAVPHNNDGENDNDLPLAKFVWRVPMRTTKNLTHVPPTTRNDRNDYSSRQMMSIACNTPDITGYSAFWSNKENTIIALHAHHDGEDTSFYSQYGQLYGQLYAHAFWIYFPLVPGERLVDVFCRHNYNGHESPSRRMDLAFGTNKGRYMAFGPVRPRAPPRHTSHNNDHLWYEHVCSLPTDSPTCIHYNVSPRGIKRLVFEDASLEMRPSIGPHLRFPPPRTRNEMAFATTISLEGVVAVTPSYFRRGDKCHHAIIGGLLFSYGDGRPCVPLWDFRLDNVGEPIDVSSAHALYLGYFRVSRFVVHLEKVSATPTVDDETIQWRSIFFRGSMVLWHTGAPSLLDVNQADQVATSH
ncbi:uncharacterized protein SPSK_03143 [Sporothrix schenckii 1099-18]|uniref:Uncharacterized protein n=1 Tax=Sporothrix schenckii 1099-18 TaxID=1397361 RepID=A0A0F2M024_SPOSC|nr:uncharacterized protein SPSK_03143 [Sporothrix schenckii 1099-18]KJR82110.1 hypothetical protein SPSK_03143 [Sporothrix schenckii 1099-18]